jgi:hypothetical protein
MFQGTIDLIDWDPTTSYFEYTLYFDEGFTKITESSTKVAKNAEGEEVDIYYYETDMSYKRKF